MSCSEQAPRLDVLLVDDDRNDATLLGMGIDQSGLNIWLQRVPTPMEAIAYLQGKGVYADHTLHPAPHLLVLDWKMPSMSGLEFLQWRGNSPAAMLIPVIVLSGSDCKTDRDQALAAGVADYLHKPFEVEGWSALAPRIWHIGMSLRGLNP